MAGGAYTIIQSTSTGDNVRIDITWEMENSNLMGFSINVSLLEGDKASDIYRVDTRHGYLHEHKFWKSAVPEEIRNANLKMAFKEKKDEVGKNMGKWIMLFKQKRGEIYGQNI